MRLLKYPLLMAVTALVLYALYFPFIDTVEPEEEPVVWLEPLEHPLRTDVMSYVRSEQVRKRLAYPTPAPAKKPLPDFDAIADINEKKQAFFAFLGPHVARENNRLRALRKQLLEMQAHFERNQPLTVQDYAFLYALYDEFRMDVAHTDDDSFNELLKRVDILPASLVLMQAANESAWGTSRFAVEGLNFFGQWCFREGCGLVPLYRGEDQFHEVARFETAAASIRSYFYNLNTFHSYEELREIRAELRSRNKPVRGEDLARGLLRYSERGEDYIAEISGMIRFNCPIMQEVQQVVAITPSC
ncbi:glucosaminidase domain-containing protein [Alkalimonas sp. MEB108]|uniref:Glucosaminidase domain-containing protein n=1 Tax=Alkalimonas cellulosilytica TaxID=3058395 RepID=A0ABU7J283_9GAMM|nr:glucosaminidase domain-containing protein [Alkalimonas sp. MEB108]MEE2000537.1 glucosaminidase domain-containing protein [Alkalimonas sp. MEB108]